jgi:hypothetical protein
METEIITTSGMVDDDTHIHIHTPTYTQMQAYIQVRSMALLQKHPTRNKLEEKPELGT